MRLRIYCIAFLFPIFAFAEPAPSPLVPLTRPTDVRDYGAIPGDDKDDSPAFAQALAAIPQGKGGEIVVPAGTYRISSAIRVNRNVVLRGASGSGWGAGTVLKVDVGVTGIVVERHINGGGDWSVIRDMALEAAGKKDVAHGIVMNARARVENLLIRGFSGDGIHIAASVPQGNANLWMVENTFIERCGGHGMFVDGTDSNNGVALNVSASDCVGWGFFDSSFLGNVYIACHTSGNGKGAYHTDEAAGKNMLIGCYSEGWQPPSRLSSRTLVLDGEHGAGFAKDSKGPILEGSDQRQFIVRSGIAAWVRGADVGTNRDVWAGIGKDDRTLTAFWWTDSANGLKEWRLRYDVSPGWWSFIYGNLGSQIPMEFATDRAGAGRAGDVRFPRGFGIGGGQIEAKFFIDSKGHVKVRRPDGQVTDLTPDKEN